jgi:phosphatidate cytidylyltransferase
MAFFVGRAFGRTQLLTLSPNKTLEGFLGGALFNIISNYYFVGYYLEGSNFWCCPRKYYELAPFENYECDLDPVYLKQEMRL